MPNFDSTSTAAEVAEGLDLSGLRAVITGGSSGLGAETARVLAGAGAEVTLAVRNVQAGRTVAETIGGNVDVAPLDLADEASVRAFAEAWDGPLHLLINNAGLMAVAQLERTPSGREMQFGTNHIGHFVLSTGLHEALVRGAEAAGGARIVSLSSRGHLVAPVDFDDPDYEHRPYNPFGAYGQSKTANVLFAVEAARRWADDGITANAVHPGSIGETNLYRYFPEAARMSGSGKSPADKTVAQGAATTVYVAVSPETKGITGRYFEDCHEATLLGPDVENLLGQPEGVAWYAVDADNAVRLWELSERLTG